MSVLSAELSDGFISIMVLGAFNNYVDKKRWLSGQPNVHFCPLGVGTVMQKTN